jgi:serine/threonine-protein kinase
VASVANPGDILLGKYRVDDVIGVGGMGRVVKASHLYLQQPVAIKILLPQMVESQSTVARFLREAQSTVRLRSEHIARVMDVGTLPEGTPFIVMEYLDGFDLNQILRHHGPQLAQPVVDLILQACEGLAEAHSVGIVHRDIKPSNFFITRRPDGSTLLKILDFGISKTPQELSELTGTQTVIGTPTYMAPEQMRTARNTDPRSDIWSMGVVMYQLLNGRPPFAGASYAELVLKVGLEPPLPMMVPLPNGLGEIILRCMEKDPALRHQNVGDLARMLAPYASDPQSAAQTAVRCGRILLNRGGAPSRSGLLGMNSSPITAGGLSTSQPLAPAQLTPHSQWPASQGTSLSQGVGQVSGGLRVTRGWMIAGIVGLCVLFGVGGYMLSSRGPRAAAPVAAEPANEPPAMNAPAAAARTPSSLPHEPAAAASPPPAAGSSADVPSTWKSRPVEPTIVDTPVPAAAPPRPAPPPPPAPDPRVDSKPAAPAVRSSDSPSPSPSKPTRSTGKPKRHDDLFDSRK